MGIRWFLLNKLLGARPAEIARMEGVKNPSAVCGMIIRVSDQLRCGEISLFEKDLKEAEAVKARLEAKRAKRRNKLRFKEAYRKLTPYSNYSISHSPKKSSLYILSY